VHIDEYIHSSIHHFIQAIKWLINFNSECSGKADELSLLLKLRTGDRLGEYVGALLTRGDVRDVDSLVGDVVANELQTKSHVLRMGLRQRGGRIYGACVVD